MGAMQLHAVKARLDGAARGGADHAPLEMAIVGSPEYFERCRVPETPADLMKHNCLAYRFTSSGTIDRWSFTSPMKKSAP